MKPLCDDHRLTDAAPAKTDTREAANDPCFEEQDIHPRPLLKSEMESLLRGNDGKEYLAIQVIGRLSLLAKPFWS